MKEFVFNIAYRLKGCTSAPVQDMQLVAHSIQDAKSAFMLWQLRTQHWSSAQPEPLYTIVAVTKLDEVNASEQKKQWLRYNPNRLKSQIYVCPWCQETCYCHSNGCDYRFCPRCGRRVL